MKKLFILALSVMMILSLTACGKKKSEDIEGFVKNVEEKANPSWNICVTADDKLVDQNNGFVLVVMAPTSFNSK